MTDVNMADITSVGSLSIILSFLVLPILIKVSNLAILTRIIVNAFYACMYA